MDLERIAIVEAIAHSHRRMDTGKIQTVPIDVRNFRSVELRLEVGNIELLVEDEGDEDDQQENGAPELPPAEPEASPPPVYTKTIFQWLASEDGEEYMAYGDPVTGVGILEGEYLRFGVYVSLPFMKLEIDRTNCKVGFRSAQYTLGGPHFMPHDTGIPLTIVPHNHGHPLHVGQDTGNRWGGFTPARGVQEEEVLEEQTNEQEIEAARQALFT